MQNIYWVAVPVLIPIMQDFYQGKSSSLKEVVIDKIQGVF